MGGGKNFDDSHRENLSATLAAIGPNHNLDNIQYFPKHFFRHPRTSLIRNLFLHALRFPFDLQALPTFKCANMISERIISLKVRIICWLIFVSLYKYHKQINDINIFLF